jgi:hypothetical protein
LHIAVATQTGVDPQDVNFESVRPRKFPQLDQVCRPSLGFSLRLSGFYLNLCPIEACVHGPRVAVSCGIVEAGNDLRHSPTRARLIRAVCALSTSRITKVAVGLLSVFVTCIAGGAGNPEQSRVIDGMIRQQAARFERFEGYTRVQHYSVETDRFGLKADMVARIHRDRVKGKSYEVISRSGSPVIQSHVFDALLEAEVAANQLGGELLTLENYTFRLLGREDFGGRPCYVLESDPRRKDKHLLKGRIWVDPEDFGIVHIEGRPSDSLSFWVGRPMIVQDFTKISGFWWASRRRSYIDNIFLGKSDLVIEYRDYQFEVRPQDMPAAMAR